MNQLQHEQYRKVNQSEYPCSDHPKISLMRTENCAEGRSQTAEHPLNEYLRGLFPFGSAREIGAVNCVKIVREDNCIRLTGYNTDTEGFRLSLSDFIPPTVTRALILGNGGAAQAVRYTLKKLGISSLTVSRNPQGENEIGYADVHRYLPTHFLIVNTTPLGTWPDTATCPSIPYEQLTPAHYLFDLVYNPDITLFMQQGLQAGAHVRNGLGMLIGQAEAAWKIWNNR